MEGKFSLLIVDKYGIFDKINISFLEEKFECCLKETEDENNLKYDIILDLNNLELYLGFNKEFITDFEVVEDIVKINDESILSKIKAVDFDIPLALEMLGGSMKVFTNVLINYLEEYGKLENLILQFLESEDYDSIRKLVHKIKGVSLYLGSEKLLALASDIEYKIYNNISSRADILYFINYHNRMLEYVREQVENV